MRSSFDLGSAMYLLRRKDLKSNVRAWHQVPGEMPALVCISSLCLLREK